jgi:hypothetical protein
VRAFQVFGRETLLKVPPNKEANDLLISHVCGTGLCVKRRHLVLEPKWVNDQRVHCHFLVHLLMEQGKVEEAKALRSLVMEACPHYPTCFSYPGGWAVNERIVDVAKFYNK